MQIDIITIFPELITPFLEESLLSKAIKKKILKIKAHNLRDFSCDKHRVVDDKPFGGGRGMVFKAEPLLKAVEVLKELNSLKGRSLAPSKAKVVLFSPRGKKFNQKMASKWAKLDQLILISGRYEGIDERVAKYIADEVVSIGDYVLMGGELPALVVIEAVVRLLPGVLGHSENLTEERVAKGGGFVEYPQYTRPEVIEIKGKKRKVPKVLLSGYHKEIDKWRAEQSKVIE
ncbi:tRNA (guanosine(37)-N1)-methyltransferase TrmD [bacterium (Candidatus Gribaldobacteria) CG10_big_fil_rev_8_21_14_0_10_37_21]|uniref:tRNA (guanine-N(1)-)-methyltransferase n=1 Tax=bacterium (Candidatus Gribaldobacteria) CG10_big_fil_rev_8_21_14_0_10_37_21 TaxID=2014275 RepID=A0A2H0UUC7_9BACT|nr:MAG: tRNA (guanosine(37)-N1)-methyltransferase TrmD [bacterium (Candidatus Gribaldobacteria) CG10_big_fil_rev_8_21_14_0_10_37_21]